MEAGTDEGLVVGDQDADHATGSEDLSTATGSRAETSKPPPGAGPARRSPPRAWTRSVMPRSPLPGGGGGTGSPLSDTARTAQVATMLARATNPAEPNTVDVSRPSDTLASRLLVADSITSLLLGLGAIALLVGGVGIANVMVISVLERRTEIGLRRALGAARRHIAAQFLGESLLLSALGGAVGAVLGTVSTYAVATSRSWQTLVPMTGVWGGLAATLVIGALAGLYPAGRAARLNPTDALRTS